MSKELESLLSLLDSVTEAKKWNTDEHTKALWLEAVLERYWMYQKSLK